METLWGLELQKPEELLLELCRVHVRRASKSSSLWVITHISPLFFCWIYPTPPHYFIVLYDIAQTDKFFSKILFLLLFLFLLLVIVLCGCDGGADDGNGADGGGHGSEPCLWFTCPVLPVLTMTLHLVSDCGKCIVHVAFRTVIGFLIDKKKHSNMFWKNYYMGTGGPS